MGGSILGERVLRKEDPKFLTSGGKYVDDLLDEPLLKGALHVTYARSTVAHGRINSIDVSDAVGMPGVVAVLNAADLDLQPVTSSFNPAATRTLLATDKVRYVGEPIAVVLASSVAIAEDALEHIAVEIEELPANATWQAASENRSILFEPTGTNQIGRAHV